MRRSRLHLKGTPATGLRDTLTEAIPAFWDADPWKVEVFLNDLETVNTAFDITTLSTLTLEGRASDTTTDLLFGPLDPDGVSLTECTYDDWNDDDGYHAAFTIPASSLNVASGTKKIWLSVRGTDTDGNPLTFGAGWVNIAHSAHGDSEDPAAGQSGGYLYIESATLNDDQSLWVYVRGKKFKLYPNDYQNA